MSHVAMAIPSLDRIGGAERQAMLLAKGLRRRCWRVSMITLSGSGGEAATELRDCGVAFMSLNMRKGLADPRGWIRLNRWLWHERPDVLHAHLPHAAWLTRWSRLAAPVPAVVDTLHSSYTGKFARRFGYRCSRWLAHHQTAVSEATAATHLAARMAKESRLSLLANGIELEDWRPDPAARIAARRELGLADGFLWLAVGRLEAVKDYPTLLRALATIPQTARLVLLGSGPLENELRELNAQLGLEQRVRFLGFQANVGQWMQAADGFVLSSRFEGLPMVLLEAAASGLPAVATDVPGTREAIVHEQTGLLAQAGDPTALSAMMARLIGMPREERSAMGERARRRVEERYSMEAILDQWETLYAKLLERSAARSIRLSIREVLNRASATSA